MPKARTAKHAITTILVPTDFSEYSRQALSYAVTEAVQWTEVYARLEATIQPMLDGLIREAEERGVAAESKLTQGVPYDQIVKTAENVNADLVVMATHGRTGMRHVLLGSVAERVVRLAPCPVLTVRSRGGET